jgi:hypothetical protein
MIVEPGQIASMTVLGAVEERFPVRIVNIDARLITASFEADLPFGTPVKLTWAKYVVLMISVASLAFGRNDDFRFRDGSRRVHSRSDGNTHPDGRAQRCQIHCWRGCSTPGTCRNRRFHCSCRQFSPQARPHQQNVHERVGSLANPA